MTIIYNSNTGSGEKYAKMLSEKTGFPCVSLQKSKSVSPEEEIIFIGWIMAGTLQGLNEVTAQFPNISCICAVSISKGEKAEDDIKAKNNITLPIFLLPGAFNINNLSGMYKMIMNMTIKMMKGKVQKDSEEAKAFEVFEKGVDLVNEEHLAAVLEFLGK